MAVTVMTAWMRTASAAKFIMCYNGEVDAGTGATQIELRGQESGEEIDGTRLSTKFPGGGNGELRSGKRANKIWDKIVSGSDVQVHGGCEGKNDELGSSAVDGRGFSFPLQKSVSLDRLTKNEGQAREKQKHGFVTAQIQISDLIVNSHVQFPSFYPNLWIVPK